jgi:hypothetical protein
VTNGICHSRKYFLLAQNPSKQILLTTLLYRLGKLKGVFLPITCALHTTQHKSFPPRYSEVRKSITSNEIQCRLYETLCEIHQCTPLYTTKYLENMANTEYVYVLRSTDSCGYHCGEVRSPVSQVKCFGHREYFQLTRYAVILFSCYAHKSEHYK